MIGEQLHRHGAEDGRHEGVASRDLDHLRGLGSQAGDAGLVRNQDDAPAARRGFLQIGGGFFEEPVAGREHDHRHGLVDQRDRAMLHLAGGIALGVDIGKLLELQGSFHGDGEGCPAPQEQDVRGIGQRLGHGADARISSEYFGDLCRQFGQRLDQLGFARRIDLAARPGRRQGEAGEDDELRGEGLGGGNADLRAREGRQHPIGFPRNGTFR